MSDVQLPTVICNHLLTNALFAYKCPSDMYNPKFGGCEVKVCKIVYCEGFKKPMGLQACSIKCLDHLEMLWTRKKTTHKNNIFPIVAKL